ncbi:hypothetical protein Scep_013358 [Stephania cephalantha]|uniref:DNA polymerase eta n=1 Tax=Stephania cephalantha TaxID=152367 RepID=A0AAP0JJ01_9MAGN
MPVARPEPSDARVIALVDMDCFYVQVEQRRQPQLRGLPTAVVQYNSWKGGGLIAISYEARKYGVNRSMRGDEAKKLCPEIQLVQVPVARGKADLNLYRNAGSEVVSILARKGRCERASIDEVYLDLTDAAEAMLFENPPEKLEAIDEETLNSHILGLDEEVGKQKGKLAREWLCRSNATQQDKLLACGAIIVAELRMQVLRETEFTCSAGIAHNKLLAKLASSMNKPAQQTVVPSSAVKGMLDPLPIKKMKQLGGKLGSSLQSDLGISTVGDLLKFTEEKLQEHYGTNTGTWLWNIARGISGDEVEGRLLPKSHGCGKNFAGPQALKTLASVESWLKDLCEELSERLQSDLDQNNRVAHSLTLHAAVYKTNDADQLKKFPSKSCPLRYGASKIQEDALKLFNSGLREFLDSQRAEIQGTSKTAWVVTHLSVSASKILAKPSGTHSILRFFHSQDSSSSSKEQTYVGIDENSIQFSPSGGENQVAADEVEAKKDPMINRVDSNPIQGDQREVSYHKGTNSILRLFHNLDPSCPSQEQTYNEISQNSIPSLPSGSENRMAADQVEATKETLISHVKSYLARGEMQKETTHKGSGPILRFFQAQRLPCTSSDNAVPSTSGAEHEQELDRVGTYEESRKEKVEINDDLSSLHHEEHRPERWRLNPEEIDTSVIDELPPEIQHEIRGWLQPLKRAKTATRGSSIADYFSPAKKGPKSSNS